MWGLVAIGGSILTGGLVVTAPVVAAAPPVLAGLLAYITERGQRVWWDIFILAMGGSLILGAGFANIGIGPAPIADLLLVLLLVRARSALDVPFLLGGLFIVWAAIRLYLNYPEYGIVALRDFTLPLEMLWAVVGFWMMARYGREHFIGAFRWVFLGVIALALLSQWPELHEISPTVGIDRETALLGYAYSASLASAFFFFVLVRPFGKFSYVLASAALVLAIVAQTRSLYILMPLTVVILILLAQRSRARIFVSLCVGMVVMMAVISLAPPGRLGPTSPDFLVEHFQTLRGAEGPGSGSIDSRQMWLESTIETVNEEPLGWLVGVGLGPDLISGFSVDTGLVRKPHNDYLEVYARLGIVGLFLFLVPILIGLKRITFGARRGRDPFLWWILAVLILHLGQAAVQPLLFFPYGTMPVFGFMGAGLALLTRPRTSLP